MLPTKNALSSALACTRLMGSRSSEQPTPADIPSTARSATARDKIRLDISSTLSPASAAESGAYPSREPLSSGPRHGMGGRGETRKPELRAAHRDCRSPGFDECCLGHTATVADTTARGGSVSSGRSDARVECAYRVPSSLHARGP